MRGEDKARTEQDEILEQTEWLVRWFTTIIDQGRKEGVEEAAILGALTKVEADVISQHRAEQPVVTNGVEW